MSHYLIGIDLGTTNSALAYIDLRRSSSQAHKDRPEIQAFPIPQLVAPGETAHRPLLPSFLYLPGPHDLPAGATALPWDSSRPYVVGEFARQQGARVPGRLATSAKSWLCHAGVDRSAPLLPWSAPADVARISPVEVAARYLKHLVESWNYVMARNQPEDRLEKQTVVLTVPASFDDVARNLTVEAARKAGLENVTLLEEPQAAFYCWLATHATSEIASLKPGARCLVVDVGGGTSDFSLIETVEQQGELSFVRQAVGDHLLLGGDNMDLALAKFVETRLPAAGRLDAAQYGMLTQACRLAKETLLSPQPPDSFTVTVMGRGRQVIGGAQHAALTPDDVRRVVFDGFFPLVPPDAMPARGARVGLHEMGLPYVSDPAVSRHLAAFLQRHIGDDTATRRHGDTATDSTSVVSASPRLRVSASQSAPAAILFNGGVFQPAALRDRLLEVMRHWYDTPEHPWKPLVLTNPSLELAVAWGAAHYNWLRHTGGRRIGGGMARSYYVAVQGSDAETRRRGDAETTEVESIAESPHRRVAVSPRPFITVLCVVPQHLEEGQEIVLQKPELELALGQPVMFPLYTSTVRGDDHAGEVFTLSPDQLLQLPPLHTILRGGKRSGTKSVPVTLAARCTEIGTLELWCVAKEGNNRWRLEFNVRDIVQESGVRGQGSGVSEKTPASEETADNTSISAPQSAIGNRQSAILDVLPETQVQEAGRLIHAVYDSAAAETLEPQDLNKALEAVFESPRHDWPTGLCRRLYSFLAESAEQRRRSPAHRNRWYHLVGYCLRPGFGDPLDTYRVEQLWKLLHSRGAGEEKSKSSAPQLADGGADFWIMWRRVAGGLNASLQNTLFHRLRPALLPAKGKASVKPHANELAEMWRAAAALERLDAKQKESFGDTLLKSLRRSPVPTYAFWALTRLGARVLLYGPLNAVVHHETAERWLDAILNFQPGNEHERLSWAFCLAQLARRSGQRALDVDDGRRQRVLTVLQSLSIPKHWTRMVEEVSELEGEEQSQMFGESLPIGLRLLRDE